MHEQANLGQEMLPIRNGLSHQYSAALAPGEILNEFLNSEREGLPSFQAGDSEALWDSVSPIVTENDTQKLDQKTVEAEKEGTFPNSRTPYPSIFYPSIFGYSYSLPRPPYLSDLDNVYDLINQSQRIIILMGAGASSGPDFRSPGGLYDSIAQSGALEDPYDVFDLEVYREKPEIFWQFAHLIFPTENPLYSATHLFVEMLEKRGKLLRVYSQNVDTLERGIPDDKLRCVHGSWRENRCISCGHVYSIDDLRPAVNACTVPRCVVCGGTIKPGIVFFGQQTNIDDAETYSDAAHADLLIVIGTSLKVAPISELPTLMWHVPSILINREPVPHRFSAELLGECDDIVHNIEKALGWPSELNDCALSEDKESLSIAAETREVKLYPPNKFIFPSESKYATTVIETSHNTFLVTPKRITTKEFAA